MLNIGTAQVDITPEQPFLMGGSFKKFYSEEIMDPLMASCVVADDGTNRVAMVSCDLGTLPSDLVELIRAQAGPATGIPAEQIHIGVTHTHSGPTVRVVPFADDDSDSQARHTAMREKLVEDIAASIVQAHQRMTPARMGYGRGTFHGGAWNRRFIMSNGRSRMHGGKGLERLRAEGPVDPEVQAVWFEDHEARPLAVMVNYSSHTTNLYGKPLVSADFPGTMREVLQGVLGKDVPVLYVQGACGNIMCKDLMAAREEGLENIRRIGRGLAGETLRIMADHHVTTEEAAISCTGSLLQIPYREILPLKIEEAEESWAYYKSNWEEFLRLDIEERAAINSTLRTADWKRTAPTETVEISAFAIGNVFFVTNPAELFVEYQLQLKEHFHGRKLIMSELTNGWSGYVPTRLACAMGGYETIQTRFDPDAGEQIFKASRELLEQLIHTEPSMR